MTITENDDLLCVEIDTETPTQTYQSYIEDYKGTPRSQKFNLADTFTTTSSKVGSDKTKNGFKYLDEMLSRD